MNTTEIAVMYVVAAVMFTAVLSPLLYAAVLDGRYNAAQQRLATRGSQQPTPIVRQARPSTSAFATA